jgi:hypothetical protein
MGDGQEPDDKKVLLCAPWSAEVFVRIPGNSTGKCDFCGASVVISPEGSQLIAEEPDTTVVCPSCVDKVPDLELDATPEITPEVSARVRAVTGIDPEEIVSGASVGEFAEKIKRQEERRSGS